MTVYYLMGYLTAPAVKLLWRQSWVLLGQRQLERRRRRPTPCSQNQSTIHTFKHLPITPLSQTFIQCGQWERRESPSHQTTVPHHSCTCVHRLPLPSTNHEHSIPEPRQGNWHYLTHMSQKIHYLPSSYTTSTSVCLQSIPTNIYRKRMID